MKCKRSAWSCPYHACMSDDCQRKEVIRNGSNFGVGLCRKAEDEIRRMSHKQNFSTYLLHSKTLPISFTEAEPIKRTIRTKETANYVLRGNYTIEL